MHEAVHIQNSTVSFTFPPTLTFNFSNKLKTFYLEHTQGIYNDVTTSLFHPNEKENFVFISFEFRFNSRNINVNFSLHFLLLEIGFPFAWLTTPWMNNWCGLKFIIFCRLRELSRQIPWDFRWIFVIDRNWNMIALLKIY